MSLTTSVLLPPKIQEFLYYIAIFQGGVGKKASGAALHTSVRFRFIEVLSRITATRFILDVPNKFPSAVSMSTVSPWRKVKGEGCSLHEHTEKNRGTRQREGE